MFVFKLLNVEGWGGAWTVLLKTKKNLFHLLGKSPSERSGPQSTHLDRGSDCLCKNAFDSLFIYLNWSAVIKSSMSHYSLLERSRVLPFAKIFEWLGPKHGPCQSDGKHSLCLLDSLACCCKSRLPVRGTRLRLRFENLPESVPERSVEPPKTVQLLVCTDVCFAAARPVSSAQFVWPALDRLTKNN